ncbi:uncharacterized protein LOC114539643 [Dendronephthya gigantea]|uniref:uncharacterized protein LOC114539643 n=1 Tax=Dendronephthya gigantea TaxID=151771 RepID=UPI00106D3133|nr:uncharacterized protein LOC114539643 [Dendronephthya gigantea]
MSDNGPQYISEEFKQFSQQWKFQHITSSPIYPQSNGKVEAAVKSAKTIMKKAKKAGTDPYLALLEYRNTPTQGLDSSPVLRLMSRRTRTPLPSLPALLEPVVFRNTYDKLLKNKEKQANQYNQRAKDLRKLSTGDTVRLIPPGDRQNQAVKARVNGQVGPRSFAVETESGAIYRRNRRHLRRTKEDFNQAESAVKLHSGVSTPLDRVPEKPCNTPPEKLRDTPSKPTPEVPPLRQSSAPEPSVTNSNPSATEGVTTAQPPIVTRSGRTVRKPKYLESPIDPAHTGPRKKPLRGLYSIVYLKILFTA